MSGHSKWSTIKRKKGANDAKRGKLFAKLTKAVEVAARQGGSDPASNAALSRAIDKAKSSSVPNDNIERAIARGSGEQEGVDYEEMWYEGYGPGGVAFYVQVLTDNRNRAASDVRSTFTRNGGALGEPGSVGYLFDAKGSIVVNGDEETVMLAAIDAGAEDVAGSDGVVEVITSPTEVMSIRDVLATAGLSIDSADLIQMPKSTVPVDDADARKVIRLVEALEDLDDVQTVYANYDISDSVLSEFV